MEETVRRSLGTVLTPRSPHFCTSDLRDEARSGLAVQVSNSLTVVGLSQDAEKTKETVVDSRKSSHQAYGESSRGDHVPLSTLPLGRSHMPHPERPLHGRERPRPAVPQLCEPAAIRKETAEALNQQTEGQICPPGWMLKSLPWLSPSPSYPPSTLTVHTHTLWTLTHTSTLS